MTRILPPPARAKTQAKRLREQRSAEGHPISHAQALEQIAHSHGFRDWNALHAAIRDLAPEDWSVGGRLTGRYLSQPFAATVRSVEPMRPGWFRLVLDLDEAVDVVTFDSFSNLRKQIRVVVGPDGRSKERTSDGAPHVQLDP
jgi:hypothetical protein